MPLSASFLDLLVHPVRKTPLHPAPAGDALLSPDTEDRFAIKEGVPILLPATAATALETTALNNEEGTRFQYREHYQTDAAVYNYAEEPHYPVEREEAARLHSQILARIPAGAKWVLDVGCGGAWLAAALVPGGRQVVSMDVSDINPIRALKRVPGANHHALVADVFALPIKPGSMDCIVACEVIEHIPDPALFLAELFTALKPGGTLIVTTPYAEVIRTSLCIHCNRPTPHNAHLHSFTEASIKAYVPPGARAVHTAVFHNKLFVQSRLQRLARGLPLSAHNAFDRLAMAVTGKKAYRLMLAVEK